MAEKIDVFKIIQNYYDISSLAYKILIQHSLCVTKKALEITRTYGKGNVDEQFIYEASMLHDIGIFKVNSNTIGCFGSFDYIAHGYLGNELLSSLGLPKHGLVCERHTGVGLTLDAIKKQGLPIPHRDMVPISLEEKIISFADLFFSKDPERILYEKSITEIKNGLLKFGKENVRIFESRCDEFEVDHE